MCMFCRFVVCPFVLSLLVIVLTVLLRYADSDYLPLISSNSFDDVIETGPQTSTERNTLHKLKDILVYGFIA